MSFSTIRFYIILKQKAPIQQSRAGFSTIRFYIILKPQGKIDAVEIVSVPYVFTSFSNIRNHLTDKNLFQYHTFLHHSQTKGRNLVPCFSFSTIRFYIILKLCSPVLLSWMCFSTIRFYIILKRRML